jgi:hypothetical protein
VQAHERLSVLEAKLKNLTRAIAAGGEMPALVAELKTREAERQELARYLAALQQTSQVLDATEIRE